MINSLSKNNLAYNHLNPQEIVKFAARVKDLITLP
jgi:hypothetical protein